MSVVIDQVAGRVEPPPAPAAAGPAGGETAPPQEPQPGELQRQLCRLDRRRRRLQAD